MDTVLKEEIVKMPVEMGGYPSVCGLVPFDHSKYFELDIIKGLYFYLE